MIIIMVILFTVASLFIFVLSLIHLAGMRTVREQLLEDEGQKEFLDAWVRRKHSFVNTTKAPDHQIGHNAEFS